MLRFVTKRHLIPIVVFLIFPILVGPASIAVAQGGKCLDAGNVICVDAAGDVEIGVPSETALDDNEFFTVHIPTAARQRTRVHFGNGEHGLWFTNGSQRGFQPFLYGIADDQRAAMYIAGSTSPEDDIGRTALVAINGRYHGGASGGVIQNRPIFSINNFDQPASFLVDYNNRVGIGMQSPNVQLEVQGMIHTNDGLSFASRNDIGQYIKDAPQGERWTWTVRSGVARLGPAGNGNRLVVEPGGNVGIGTNTPQARLEIVDGPNWKSGWRKFLRLGAAGAAEFVTSEGTTYGIGGANGGYLSIFADAGGESTGIMQIRSGEVKVLGTTTTSVLQITGGADIAEPFAITDDDIIEPGMVVAIDPDNPGQLRVASSAYDRTVAGVVSGAGGVNSGLILQQEDALMAGEHPVALTGRVYVWADASNGAIQPGDLLTTSHTPGHAMRVSDHERAIGTILGKAMSSLGEERGLVLVQVALQ